MTWHKDEEEVDKLIEDMANRTKGKYITQGVSFNKTCPRQMAMLKMALMSSASFSGLIKELLALKMSGGVAFPLPKQQEIKPKNKNTGNFF
jgi:predicted CopG family antitoxin